jgi:riboflavin synthase
MFTGLVTAVGTVIKVTPTERGLRIGVRSSYKNLETGESIAVDGACFTVVAKEGGKFAVEVIGTSRGRTKVTDYAAGTKVNLERALQLGDRLGGHMVAGHVDGVGTIRSREEQGDAVLLDIEVPADIRAMCVPHGSITVDGVSLTVNALPGRRNVQVSLIPHTLKSTTLGGAAPGGRVHLEADLIGKYVGQLLKPYRARFGRLEP